MFRVTPPATSEHNTGGLDSPGLFQQTRLITTVSLATSGLPAARPVVDSFRLFQQSGRARES